MLPELVLGLRLEHRVLEPDGDGADHALAHVVAFEFLVGVLVDRLEQPLAKRAEVGAAIAGVLAVDERVERLAVAAVAVGETELERLLRVMQRRVDRLAAVRLEILHHQVEQAVAGLKHLAVVDQLEPAVQVAVMPQPPLDVFGQKLRGLENLRVGLEADEGPVRFAGCALLFALEFALLEPGLHELAAAMAADDELAREGVDGLGADAVEADAELEDVVVVFGAGVDLRDALDDLAQGDAPAEIADGHFLVLDRRSGPPCPRP